MLLLLVIEFVDKIATSEPSALACRLTRYLMSSRYFRRYFPERPASMWMAQNPQNQPGSDPTMEDYWEVCNVDVVEVCFVWADLKMHHI